MDLFFPVVDFAPFLDSNSQEHEREAVAKELIAAFQNTGFVYLKNYTSLVQLSKEIFELERIFFHQPLSEKLEVKSTDEPAMQGYIPVGAEQSSNNDLNDDGSITMMDKSALKGDNKEVFQVYSEEAFKFKSRWPSSIPNFQERVMNFFDACQEANSLIMRCIAIGLGIEADYFDKISYANAVRLLHYPKQCVKETSTRAGVHTDYGSITLLFQDDVGGLQVMDKRGAFIDVLPIPDTIIVNVADMLQRWSNDRLQSALHRVAMPEQPKGGEYAERFSIVYFCTPDLDLTIECLPACYGDTGPKYAPVKSGDYLMTRIAGHYL